MTIRNDKLFQLRVSGDELMKWAQAATESGMTLSKWVRGRCNSGSTDQPGYLPKSEELQCMSSAENGHQQLRELITTAVREFEAPPDPRAKVKQCAHGSLKGHHCWQCGGMANVGAA